MVNGNDGSRPPAWTRPQRAGAVRLRAQGGEGSLDGQRRRRRPAHHDRRRDRRRLPAGRRHDETFCWKDGMDDWLPLREIERALRARASATRAAALAQPPRDGVSSVQRRAAALFGTRRAQPRLRTRRLARSRRARRQRRVTGSRWRPPAAAGAPAGARRRRDLFSGAAQAGGEEEVMTSAPVGAPADARRRQAHRRSATRTACSSRSPRSRSKGPNERPAAGPWPRPSEALRPHRHPPALAPRSARRATRRRAASTTS